MQTLGEAGERAVIAAIIAAAPSEINGDDAAVLFNAPPNTRTVVTTDLLVQDRHFRLGWSTPKEIGCKAVAQNFADIEAMGARPVAVVMGLAAPAETPLDLVKGIAAGVGDTVSQHAAQLVGGDVCSADQLMISITAVGSLGGNRSALTLDSAKPGQRLVASGAIGESAAGLALLQRCGRGVPSRFVPLRDAHTQPQLTPGRGLVARATGATCATDNSDGLVQDLSLVAQRSSVSIDLESTAIAPTPLMREAATYLHRDPWEWVLTGGEDHTILATTGESIPSGFRTIGRVQRRRQDAVSVTVDGERPAYCGGWLSF